MPTTPLWVKSLLVTVLVGAPTWWLADRHDRITNQNRLAAVASQIAERPVRVRCPGPIGRVFSWDTVDGSVAFDADGRPSDETRLRTVPCAELDALAEGRRAEQLACAELRPACGEEVQRVAWAVAVLVHEAWHLHGIADEAVTECHAVQTVAWAAQELGASEPQARGLAAIHLGTGHQDLPVRYRSDECRDGGSLDMRPDDPRWP